MKTIKAHELIKIVKANKLLKIKVNDSIIAQTEYFIISFDCVDRNDWVISGSGLFFTDVSSGDYIFNPLDEILLINTPSVISYIPDIFGDVQFIGEGHIVSIYEDGRNPFTHAFKINCKGDLSKNKKEL
jgi:hypothetical protein